MRDKNGYYPISSLGENVKFPSVTHIQGILDKPRLCGWRIDTDIDYLFNNSIGPFLAGEMTLDQFREIDMPKLVADAKCYHKDVSGEAKDYGSRFHNALDNWHRDGLRPVYPDLIEPFNAVVEWEESVYLKTIESEGTVFSRTFQFAGTRDIKAEIRLDTKPLVGILDYKTRSGKNGKKPPVYPGDKQQVSAYCLADEEMNGGEPLDFGGVIIINREDNSVHPHLYMRPMLVQAGMEFIELARYFNMTRRGK
jgi:hypothetical protein